MVKLKHSKNAQAAIEFLMTYGWMLLIVLIVGALIFSFVDFGNLIPNQIQLSNDMQADATRSIAYSEDSSQYENTVSVIAQYNGARQAQIGPSNTSYIEDSVTGEQCPLRSVENLATNDVENVSVAGDNGNTTAFLNGQEALLEYDCSVTDNVRLIEGDVIEGSIRLDVEDPSTGRPVPSTGDLRLTISSG